MVRKILFAAALALAPLPAFANQVSESILSQLRAQGFTKITVSRTLLGRARVVAQSPTLDREIIYNPVTGAIIRDYWTERDSGQVGVTLVDPNKEDENHSGNDDGGTGSSGGSGDDDGGDDGDSGDDGNDGGDDSGDDGDSDGDDGDGHGGDGDSGDDGDNGGDDGGDSDSDGGDSESDGGDSDGGDHGESDD